MTNQTQVQRRRLTAHMTGAKYDRPTEFVAWDDKPARTVAAVDLIAAYNALADSHDDLLAAAEWVIGEIESGPMDLNDMHEVLTAAIRRVRGED